MKILGIVLLFANLFFGYKLFKVDCLASLNLIVVGIILFGLIMSFIQG